MRNQQNKNVDIIVIILIFFWIGIWGVITIFLDWFFEITNCKDNRPAKFLVYLSIAILTIMLLNSVLSQKDEEDNDCCKKCNVECK